MQRSITWKHFFPHTAGNNSAPKLKWFSNSKIDVEFTKSCLKEDKTTLSHGNVVHLFIVYEANTKFVCNCLFGPVDLIKNADPDKYVCNYYGNGFHSHPQYSLPNGDLGKNVIFRVDNSWSVHNDNRKNNIVLYQRLTDE